MTELLTAAQMRAIEQAAIDSGEVTGLELMERAGRGVVEAIFEEWPELAKSSYRAVVLCGPGNNGGDGFVVARLLKEWGWEVEVFLYGDEAKLPPDAKVNCERWRGMGEIQELASLKWDAFDRLPQETFGSPIPALVVDALFGSGLSRPFFSLYELRARIGSLAELASADSAFPRVIAIDVPSGLDADSGKYLGYFGSGAERSRDECILANLCVTFASSFYGHFLADGPMGSGKISIKSIGVDPQSVAWLRGALIQTREHPFLCKPGFLRSQNAALHKFSYGHALVLSGGVGKGGAARLAARGALRIGAGLVTVGCPPSALIENAAQLNAIMLQPMKDADALEEALKDARITALCLGPGMGISERTRDLTAVALKTRRPIVLDADGLSILFFDEADALFGRLHNKCVLTPHAGEFARLFPDIAEKLNAPATKGPAYSKVDATREAAKRAGCVVLFKGPDTVIAAPDGRASINSAHYDRSAPWLATAGSGDVLAGFIVGLLARGFSPMQAAETAAWLHVECARAFGPGLIAEDLPDVLPTVFRSLKV